MTAAWMEVFHREHTFRSLMLLPCGLSQREVKDFFDAEAVVQEFCLEPGTREAVIVKARHLAEWNSARGPILASIQVADLEAGSVV